MGRFGLFCFAAEAAKLFAGPRLELCVDFFFRKNVRMPNRMVGSNGPHFLTTYRQGHEGFRAVWKTLRCLNRRETHADMELRKLWSMRKCGEQHARPLEASRRTSGAKNCAC